MAFSDFDLRTALEKFSLQERRDTRLFPDVAPLPPTQFLQVWLDEFAPVAIGLNTEKARSEFITARILVEAKRRSVGPANVVPGLALEVDRSQGLNGSCDYIISRSDEYFFVRGPLLAAVIEAKREDLIGGLGQCAASIVAIRQFNEKDGTPVSAVYGCVSSGTNWRFLKLEGSILNIDREEYYLGNAGQIVGILVHIIGTGVRD